MLGILGGTFDPIHHGHLRTALDVQQALDLEQVLLIPLGDPPHRERPDTTPQQRLAMVRAAVAGVPVFQVDERELNRDGLSYTLDTLLSLRRERGSDRPLCLLLGSDAFRGFPRWHQPAEILKLVHLVVMLRPGEPRPDLYPTRLTADPRQLRATPGGRILFQQVTQLEISSTRIRELLRRGRDPRFLLPDPVLSIIRQQHLYL